MTALAEVAGAGARSPQAHGCSSGETHQLVLHDGRRFLLRQLRADDRDRLVALFARLSPESRRQRFLGPKDSLTSAELTFLTTIDHHRHEAIAAIHSDDGSLAGVARYVQHANRPSAAELAAVVADDLQHLGLGTALAGRAIHSAIANGYEVLTATTRWENRPARAVLTHLGFRAQASYGGELDYELQLAPSGASGRPDASNARSRG